MSQLALEERKQALGLAIGYFVPALAWTLLADWLLPAGGGGATSWPGWHAVEGSAFALVSAVGVYFAVRLVQTRRPIPARDLSRVPDAYRALFENNPDPVYFLDGEGRYTDINDAGCALRGLPREAIVGRHFSEFVSPDIHEEVEAQFRQILDGRVVYQRHDGLVTASGDVIPVSVSGIPVIVDGEVVGACGITKDLTDERLAERTVAEREERYRSLFEHHPEAVYSLDLEGYYTAANDRAAELAGLTRETMVGRHYTEFIDPEQQPLIAREFERVLAGEPVELEVPVVGVDGRRIEGRLKGIPIVVGGEVVGVHGITQDISAQRRAERDLRDSEERHRTMFESALDGVLLSDPKESRVLAANPAACKLLGGSEELLCTYGLEPFVDTKDPFNRPFLEQRTQTGASYGVLRVQRLDGEMFEAEATSVIFTNSAGQPRASWVFRDVTHRRRADEQLRLAASALANTAEGVLVLDYEGRVLMANAAYTEITGYHEHELAGTAPPAADKADRDFMRRIRQQALEDGEWKGEFWARRRDGSLYPVLLSVSAVRDDRGAATHLVVALNDISTIKDYEARLEHIVHHDPVTGLANLTLVSERARAAMLRADRHGGSVAAVLLGLDGFKTVNDSLGFAAGDELLRQVGERLSEAVRETDTVARQGSDEFVILLDELNSAQDAAIVAGKLLDALGAPLLVRGQSILTTASIGISCYPDDGDEIQTLLRNADNAMHRAKRIGRNSYQYYSPEMAAEANRTLQLRTCLHQALPNGELQVRFQPFVSLEDGRITGFEALLRWHSAELGPVSPGEFIPVAEETGLILPIGEWVLRESCRQLKELQRAGYEDLRVAVNLSARQFRQDDLADRVALILEETGLEGDDLELEITETVAMERSAMTRDAIQALSALGVRLALDDFGTGHSSLSYLKDFPISFLKIDKSFVDGLPDDRDDHAIAETIVDMARNLELRVTAEGVETSTQLVSLRNLECHEAQGFLFSAALDPKDLEPLLQRQNMPVPQTSSNRGKQ